MYPACFCLQFAGKCSWRGTCSVLANDDEQGLLGMTKRPGCLRLYAAFAVLVALATSGEAKTFRWPNVGDPTTMGPQARSARFVPPCYFNMYEAHVLRERML